MPLPDALARKFPTASTQWPWRWVFPAVRVTASPGLRPTRGHMHPTRVQRAMHQAVQRSGISKRAGCHTLRRGVKWLLYALISVAMTM